MFNELAILRENPGRIIAILFALAGLAAIFILQQFDYLGFFCRCGGAGLNHFIFNKTFRLLLNDVCMLVIINYWFADKKIVKLAIAIQLIDILVLLPVYFIMKLSLEGISEISSPLLSQLHRLIVNPTLMILLFPAIYIQRLTKSNP